MRIQKRGVDLDLDWNPELEETDELYLGDIPGGWGVNERPWMPEMGLLPRFRKEDEMMGYWDLHNDSWGIEPQYKLGTLFHDGLAAVCLEDERWFFIDNKIAWREEGLFLVYYIEGDKSGHDSSTSNFGFIDRYGDVKIKLPADCVSCWLFDEGLAIVYYSDDMQDCGYMDHWGTIVKGN